jgi:hypothetical protein
MLLAGCSKALAYATGSDTGVAGTLTIAESQRAVVASVHRTASIQRTWTRPMLEVFISDN